MLACGPAATAPLANSTPAKPLALSIRYERTTCYGSCPTYVVEIDGRGRVFWHGREYVATVGDAVGQLRGGDLELIERAIDRARFFERNDRGDLPCPKTGRCVRVSCSDTSSSKIAITRGGQTNTIEYENCGSQPDLEALVNVLDTAARTQQWIGSRRY